MEYVMQTDMGSMKADGELDAGYVVKRVILTGVALAFIYLMVERE
jgi:hypothetical protein